MSDNVHNVTDQDWEQSVLNSDQPVLVDAGPGGAVTGAQQFAPGPGQLTVAYGLHDVGEQLLIGVHGKRMLRMAQSTLSRVYATVGGPRIVC